MYGFPRSHLELDDKWAVAYGDLEFDRDKFPDAPGMVRRLRETAGFAITLWITPFAERASVAYVEGRALGHWLRGADGLPLAVRWWQGEGVVLNVSDAAALDWMERRLRVLMDSVGVVGFKFDAGEAVFVPEGTMADPNKYAQQWARFAARFGGCGEVRSAHHSQGAGVWVREFDKDSRWGVDNGLRSLITSALHLGVVGYPFALPDMVGGNAYSDLMTTESEESEPPNSSAAVPLSSLFYGSLPSRELYVRWCFANALLPAMQFSIAPWQYDSEAVEACRKALQVRDAFLPLIESLAVAAGLTGAPIVRPLWWHDPIDHSCMWVDDEFLLGNTTLVAPILEAAARSRSIYLPRGRWRAWRDPSRERSESREDQVHVGPLWLIDHPVALDEVAVFQLLDG